MSSDVPVTSETYRSRVAAALLPLVGDRKAFSRAMLAGTSGQDDRTVKAHCLGEAGPGGHVLLTYMAVLPETFAAAVLDLAGISGVRRVEGGISPQAALAEIAEGTAALAEALADGRIDHHEIPHLLKELREAGLSALNLAADLERRLSALRGE